MQVISCSSGTDALILGLLGLGVRSGDGIIVPSFTFAASAEAIAVLGASPVFAEEEASFNPIQISLKGAERGQESRAEYGRHYGGWPVWPASEFAALSAFAEQHGLRLLDDAAQSQKEGIKTGWAI